MPGRTLPWRHSCPKQVVQRLRELASARMLLIHEKGPTSFVIKELPGVQARTSNNNTNETSTRTTATTAVPSSSNNSNNNNNNKKFTVGLGEVHSCTCLNSQSEMCIHILYVLQKVFRIPSANPLLWQRSFIDAELQDLVNARNRMRMVSLHQERLRRAGIIDDGGNNDDDGENNNNNNNRASSSSKSEVQRKPLDGDDSCPICCDGFENITSDSEELVWCRFGCGGSIHVECFRQYCQHHATRPEPLSCPLCRTKWGQLEAGDFGGDLPKHAPGTRCDACRSEITYGERFRCCFCPRFDLCPNCYRNRPHVHAQHPFDFQEQPNARFRQAPPRPLPAASSNNSNQTSAIAQQIRSGVVDRRMLNDVATSFSSAATSASTLFESPTRGNNNNSSEPRRLTLNEALRFAKPFSQAIVEHVGKYSADNYRDESSDDTSKSNAPCCPVCLEEYENKTRRENSTNGENGNDDDEDDDNNPSLLVSSTLPERLIVLPSCKHLFHLTCGTQWLCHGAAICPFCKIPVTTVDLNEGRGMTATDRDEVAVEEEESRTRERASGSSPSSIPRSPRGGARIASSSSPPSILPQRSRQVQLQQQQQRRNSSSSTTGVGAAAALSSLAVAGRSTTSLFNIHNNNSNTAGNRGQVANPLRSRIQRGRPTPLVVHQAQQPNNNNITNNSEPVVEDTPQISSNNNAIEIVASSSSSSTNTSNIISVHNEESGLGIPRRNQIPQTRRKSGSSSHLTMIKERRAMMMNEKKQNAESPQQQLNSLLTVSTSTNEHSSRQNATATTASKPTLMRKPPLKKSNSSSRSSSVVPASSPAMISVNGKGGFTFYSTTTTNQNENVNQNED